MRNPAPIRTILLPGATVWLAVAGIAFVAGCGGPRPAARTVHDASARDAHAWAVAVAEQLEALTASPDDVATRYRLAYLYASADSADVALRHCEHLLTLAPDHDGGLSLWSKLQFEHGAHTIAIERLHASRARRGELPELLRIGLALHLDAIGDHEASAREFASVKAPSSAKVYHVLRSDEYLHAGELARAALDAEPRSAASHNNYGITRLYAGDPEAARAAFLRALELQDDFAGALYNLAIVDAFYFFDEAQGRAWFERYRATGAFDDPDGLGELLAGTPDAKIGEQARR